MRSGLLPRVLTILLSVSGWGGTAWDKALTVLLSLSVLGAMAAASYTIATPKDGEEFTEFYILGPYGIAADYPRSVTVGQKVEVTVGIVNHENDTVSYRLLVMLNGIGQTEIEPIVLAKNEVWERAVGFAPDKPGEDQEVEFYLFKQGNDKPYLAPLNLFIDVIEQ